MLQDLKVIYTRDFAFGGQQLTEEIMRTYGLSMEEAGRAKKEGGLPSNYQPEVLDPFIDDMSQQVSRSLQFFLASGGGREQPEQILICGGCANIPGVAEIIASRVGIEIAERRSARADEGFGPGQGARRGQGCDRVADGLRSGVEELRLTCRESTYSPGAQSSASERKKSSSSRSPARLIVAAGVVYRVEADGAGLIDDQKARNQISRPRSRQLDKQIAEILELETQKERLLARMQVIEQLQRWRPEIVHVFDQLVRAMPDGVYLTRS